MLSFLKNWNLIRTLRLALGIFILIQGIVHQDWNYIIIGGIFSMLPLFNLGCCGTSTCSSVVKNKSTNHKETQYEEIH